MSLDKDRNKPLGGFLLVKSFEILCFEYDRPARPDQKVYGIPRSGVEPSSYSTRYLGVGRDCLNPWFPEFEGLPNPPFEIEASKILAQLEIQNRSIEGHIERFEDAMLVFENLKTPSNWQIIWANHFNLKVASVNKLKFLGYEPNYFSGDHFSPIMDSMFFPRWNGTDESGQLYLSYFERLNSSGLFSTVEDSERFLEYYLNLSSELNRDR